MPSALFKALLSNDFHFSPRKHLPPAFVGFLLGLLFGPKDGVDMFLRNIGLSPNYLPLHLRDRILQSHRYGNLKSNTSHFLSRDSVWRQRRRCNGETFTRRVDPELGKVSFLAAAKSENVPVLFSGPKCNGIALRLKVSNERNICETQISPVVSRGTSAQFP
jgi:hypothetical protein